MIHCAWCQSQGNADEMRSTADMLDAHDETMVDIYASETGKTKEDIRSAMEAETWIKGSDAVAWGLADESDGDGDEDDAEAAYRPLHPDFISRCKNLSPDILNAIQPKPVIAPNSAAPKPAGNNNQQPKQNIMNKTIIVALLFEHGIKNSTGKDFAETDTDAEFEAGLKALAKKQDLGADARFKAIEAQLALAEERRITAKVLTYVEAGKITNAEAPIFVKAAMTDEPGTLAILDKKEITMPGGSAIGWSGIETGISEIRDPEAREGLTGAPLQYQTEILANIRKEHKTPQARHAAMKTVYDRAIRQAMQKDEQFVRKNNVQAANTYTGTIITNFLMDGSITDLVNVWAFLGAYTLAKDVDPYKPLATGQLKHVTVGETTQVASTAPTSFEPSDGSTVTNIQVAVNWFNQPMRVGANDLNSGLRMEDLRTLALAKFSNSVTEYATAPITAANFTATPVITSAVAFGLSDLATLQGQLQKAPMKSLILDGTYLARIANQPGFYQKTGQGLMDNQGYKPYGWEGIYLASDWSGAGSNIKGFACAPQAIVRATGLPLNPPNIPGGVFSTTTFELPGLEIAVAMSTWFSLATRTMFVSWDVIAGFAAADKTAGVIVASGTPT
jgi:hypothetical protein